MPTKTHPLTFLTLISLLILLSFPKKAVAIPVGDLDGLLTLLRANGHVLFANAISTSDILFDLLSAPSLTLLAPTDPALFALDMTQTRPFYLSTLRLHALPRRLSWADILLLPNNSLLPTLLASRDLPVITGRFGNILVGGAPVVMPGLYYGPDVAVHGLDGILTFRSPTPTSNNPKNDTVRFRPPLNHTTVIPQVPKIPRIRINRKNRTVSSPVNITIFFPPSNHTIVPPEPRIPRIPMRNSGNLTDSVPVNGTISSPLIVSPLPAAPSNQTNGVNSTEGLHGYSPAELPDDLDFLKGKSSGFDEYEFEETSPSPVMAPMTTSSMRSGELCEAFLDSEICNAG